MELKDAIEIYNDIAPMLGESDKEALNLILEAAGKQVPKWVKLNKDYGYFCCCTCGNLFDKGPRVRFCPECGQRLIW